MKVLMINGGAHGSSWSIGRHIFSSDCFKNADIFYATPDRKPVDVQKKFYIKIGSGITRLINNIIVKIDGSDGFRNYFSTLIFLSKIRKINPDVIHLHTLHGYFINIPLLFKYIEKNHIRTIITCHDCFWFTGRCSHFYKNKCEKWINGCFKCQYMKSYPKSFFFDKTKKFYFKKVSLISKIDNLVVACVSNWLSTLCSKSLIFKDKKVITIHNGIDTSLFSCKKEVKKTTNKLKCICVAGSWNNDKGLDLINELANIYFQSIEFTIVGVVPKNLVVNNKIRIINSFIDTKNLVKEFNRADFLLNASKQETFSLINVEAQSCGLPVVCLNATGMAETIDPINSYGVDEYKIFEFQNKIDLLFNREIKSRHLSLFSTRFDYKIMISKYERIYFKDVKK